VRKSLSGLSLLVSFENICGIVMAMDEGLRQSVQFHYRIDFYPITSPFQLTLASCRIFASIPSRTFHLAPQNSESVTKSIAFAKDKTELSHALQRTQLYCLSFYLFIFVTSEEEEEK